LDLWGADGESVGLVLEGNAQARVRGGTDVHPARDQRGDGEACDRLGGRVVGELLTVEVEREVFKGSVVS